MASPRKTAPAAPVLAPELCRPFAGSEKVHVTGSRPDLRVPMRRIDQSPTHSGPEPKPNPPIHVYDTSGPYTDPAVEIDLARGLPRLREGWIAERDDTEAGERSAPAIPAANGGNGSLRTARRGRGEPVTQLAYARRGIVTPEMHYVAIRENMRREEQAAAGSKVTNSRFLL